MEMQKDKFLLYSKVEDFVDGGTSKEEKEIGWSEKKTNKLNHVKESKQKSEQTRN